MYNVQWRRRKPVCKNQGGTDQEGQSDQEDEDVTERRRRINEQRRRYQDRRYRENGSVRDQWTRVTYETSKNVTDSKRQLTTSHIKKCWLRYFRVDDSVNTFFLDFVHTKELDKDLEFLFYKFFCTVVNSHSISVTIT